MRLAGLLWVLACAEVPGPAPASSSGESAEVAAPLVVTGCNGEDGTFVRRVLLLAWAEVPPSSVAARVHTDVVAALGRDAWLDRVLAAPRFRAVWEDVLRDWLYLARAGYRDNGACTEGPSLPTATAALAEHIRDEGPLAPPFAPGTWNFTDLLRSALELDDVSVVFRVAPFVQVSGFVPDGDDPNDESSWRKVHADLFERRFLNRRMECLACHNSEYSVTGNADPVKDRTWEVPARLEEALYGSSFGRSILDVAAIFRISGVLAVDYNPGADDLFTLGQGVAPWGIAASCGGFVAPDAIQDDPLGYVGYLGRELGPRASLWDLEALYRTGIEATRGRPLETDDGALSGEAALIWLTALSFAEHVWLEVTGRHLTTPNFFPRNAAQRDVLLRLASAFVEGGFSLRAVVKAALLEQYAVLGDPRTCAQDYPFPAVFDPWVTAETVPERRGNSVGDAVTRHPPRALLRAISTALGWPEPTQTFSAGIPGEEVPYPEEAVVQGDLGLFLFFGEAGFRGNNFQETLAFEAAFGACKAPFAEAPVDFISELVGRGGSVDEGVAALSDRLLGGPLDAEVWPLVEALVGGLQEDVTDEALRRACAALLASPDFQLAGLPFVPPETPRPSPGVSAQAECGAVLERLGAPTLSCDADGRARR